MRGLIVAEVRKLTTTRAPWLIMAGVAAMALLSSFDPDDSGARFDKPFDEQTFVFFTAFLTRILILVFGIRVVTDEFRHGTIVPSLLVTPRRGRLMAAKAVAAGTFGALLGLVAWIAMTGAASAIAALDGASLRLGSEAWLSLAGMTLAGAMWALIGLGLGTIVRSQLVATVGGLVWLMGIEDAVRGWLGEAEGYLPGQAGLSMAIAPSGEVLALGATTMLVYAVLFTVGSGLAIRRDLA